MAKKKANKAVSKFDKDILLTILGVVAVVAIAVLVVLFTTAMSGKAVDEKPYLEIQSQNWRIGEDIEPNLANRGVTARDEIQATRG